ncbi:MAG: OmpH family outer membrane protein, partial [Tabrizicola sp.]|nr:OmpH family outer membrane protein [Tabrizicola sp.]
LGLAPLGAMAQDAAPDAVPESAVLTLDQDRLFAESAFGKAAIAREAEAVSALAAENLRIEKELEAEERALTARRPNTPKEEFASLAAAFDTKVERIRTEQDAKSRDIARARDVDRQRFLQSAVPVLGDLLADQSAVAIIDKGAIILSLSAIDVTDLAIQRVDSVLGDGSAPPLATAPQPAP